MTKKQRSSKQNAKENRPFRFQSLHERLNNTNINVAHRIRYHEQTDLHDTDQIARALVGVEFQRSLWQTLQTPSSTGQFRRTSGLQSWPYLRDRARSVPRTQSVGSGNTARSSCAISTWSSRWFLPLLQAIVVRRHRPVVNAFETGTEWNQHAAARTSISMFNLSVRIPLTHHAQRSSQSLRAVLQVLILFVDNEYLDHRSRVHSFAYLLRQIENYQPFIDYLFDWKERDKNKLENWVLIFSETCQNVQSSFHYCTKSLLQCLLNKLVVKLALMQPCVKSIYSLLTEQTNK